MAGSTPDDPSVSLREYFERLLAERWAAYDKALIEAVMQVRSLDESHWDAHAREHLLVERALQKQEDVQNIRNAAQNEWRGTLTDQQARFATKEWAESQLQSGAISRDAMSTRITALETANIARSSVDEERRNQLRNQQWVIGGVIGLISITVSAILHFIK